MQEPKNLQGWEIDQINWNLTHKWAMNEQNAHAQKKLYNKIRSMPSKSSATTLAVVRPVNKMWYTRIWVFKYNIFLQTIHNQPEILRVDDKYTYV